MGAGAGAEPTLLPLLFVLALVNPFLIGSAALAGFVARRWWQVPLVMLVIVPLVMAGFGMVDRSGWASAPARAAVLTCVAAGLPWALACFAARLVVRSRDTL